MHAWWKTLDEQGTASCSLHALQVVQRIRRLAFDNYFKVCLAAKLDPRRCLPERVADKAHRCSSSNLIVLTVFI